MTTRLAAALTVAMLAACGSDRATSTPVPAPGQDGNCLLPWGTCWQSSSFCNPDGEWVAACPAANRLGACELSGLTLISYPGVLDTPAEAEQECAALGGTFSRGDAPGRPQSPQRVACDRRATPERSCTVSSGLMSAERRRNEELFCTGLGGTLLPAGECPTLPEPAWTCRIALPYDFVVERHYSGAVPVAEVARCRSDRGAWSPGPPP